MGKRKRFFFFFQGRDRTWNLCIGNRGPKRLGHGASLPMYYINWLYIILTYKAVHAVLRIHAVISPQQKQL